MRKIIYVLVVVSIAIVNTVFTIRNSDEIVDLVSFLAVIKRKETNQLHSIGLTDTDMSVFISLQR